MAKIDLSKIKTYSISKRKSKVKKKDFASPTGKGSSFAKFYDSLPDILAARDFKEVVSAIIRARHKNKPVIFMAGAHLIKCGLNSLIIDLIKKDVITTVALNGAGIIHDFELALVGETSEDVAKAIEDGSFGMARETALFINNAIKAGSGKGYGIGYSVGEAISKEKLPYKSFSLLYNCFKHNISLTVHVGIGTDIIHQHPSCSGEAVGKGSLVDFHKFIEEVSELGGGGVVINVGSAVILPEVVLKALTVARNLGFKVKDFITCNFDQIYHYRPYQNIVTRPVSLGGKGYYVVGHHEVMIPLLHRAIIEKI